MTTTTNLGLTLVEANQTGKHITVNNALTAIDTAFAGIGSSVTLTGDVTGAATATTVVKIRGVAVSSTAPTTNQVLQYNGTQWVPATLTTVTSVTMGGDVTGASGTATVAKLQGRTVASTAPTNGYVLTWNNGASQWEPAAASTTSSVTMGGDVSGASGTSTVDKIKGVAVSATTPTTGQVLTYSGSSWAPAAPPFDIGLTVDGATTASEVLLRFVAPRAIAFVANFSTSHAVAATAATASTVFTIAKNGSSIGTITFAAAGTTGTWASSGGSAQSLAAGDLMTLTAPATPDATLANIGISFAGTR